MGALSIASAASAQDIRATVDGALVNFPDVQPHMMNGRVMVPMRGVFEHMKATVVWDETSHTVNVQRGTDTLRLALDSYYATLNGQTVTLDTPAMMHSGRAMVPLRFLSETLGSHVEWISKTQTVEITTPIANTNVNSTSYVAKDPPVVRPQAELANYSPVTLSTGTVMPFRLDDKLSSNGSEVGDRFTATLDTEEDMDYQNLPSGTVVEGHVDVARAKSGTTPGVLGLAFDRIRLPDGRSYKISGKLIGLDSKSVTDKNGRLVAKSGAKKNNLTYVGYGAGAGAILAVLTKGNLITNSLIGGALGYLYSEIKKDPSKANNVSLDSGSKFGVRLTRDFSFRTANVIRR